MPLPNLFVIGAPKCGTTSLHHYLDQHPSISMSTVKEPKYFLTDGSAPAHRGPGDGRADAAYVVDPSAYEALFHYPSGTPTYAGESTPFYLWDPDALTRIHAAVPDARLVAVLREPTMRAYSNWSDLRAQGREKLEFGPALDAEAERLRLGWEPFWLYRALGLYGEQLTRVFDLFPRDHVKVVMAESLADTPHDTVEEILQFLGLPPMAAPLVSQRMNQTMYRPVDRSSRAIDALFRRAEKARPVVPRVVRRWARELVRGRLRQHAASDVDAQLRARYSPLFAHDRDVLARLGVDVTRWEQRPATSPG